MYKFNGRVGAVCATCAHGPTLHRLCPKQVRGKGSKTLLAIMNVDRDPDVSRPHGVVGVPAAEVVIPPPDEAELRFKRSDRTN